MGKEFPTQPMKHRQYPPIYMTNMLVIPNKEQALIQVVTRNPQFPFAAVSALTVSEATQMMLHLKQAIQELDGYSSLCQRTQEDENEQP